VPNEHKAKREEITIFKLSGKEMPVFLIKQIRTQYLTLKLKEVA
jgi:hypothetical protein